MKKQTSILASQLPIGMEFELRNQSGNVYKVEERNLNLPVGEAFVKIGWVNMHNYYSNFCECPNRILQIFVSEDNYKLLIEGRKVSDWVMCLLSDAQHAVETRDRFINIAKWLVLKYSGNMEVMHTPEQEVEILKNIPF